VQAPWSFGNPMSYAKSVQVGLDWAVDWLLAHPHRTFLLGGYSQGGECVSRIHQETLPGGRLEALRHNYVGGFTFGNPSREFEHTFYGGPKRDGEGIAAYRMPETGDDWADEVDDGDMYGGVPANLTGEIMRDVYVLCTELEIGQGPREFFTTLIANVREVLGNLDGTATLAVDAALDAAGIDISGATIAPPERIAELAGRWERLSVKGVLAAIQACVIGLTFVCQNPPTAPHIEYHLREVFPGQTYLAHAMQHVRHWAGTRQPMQ
jgi:hypothetical protein